MTNAVRIYDPNHVNPYGVELARLLAGLGHQVELICSEAKSIADGWPDFRVDAGLPGPRPRGLGMLRWLCRRIARPVMTALWSRNRVLLVVWTQGAWDAVLFWVRAVLGGNTIFVYHNPPSVRARGGAAGAAEILLAKSSLTVVHSEWLANRVSGFASRVRVAVHPPYSRAQLTDVDQSHELEEGRVPLVGYVGALRADKGADDLQAVSRASSFAWDLVYMGPRDPIGLARLRASLYPREVRELTPDRTPSDDEMSRGLAFCDVVLAPYRAVTESGSINLALAAGAAVIGYDSLGVEPLLTERSRVDDPQTLGRTLDEFLVAPWETFVCTFAERCRSSKISWSHVLGELS